MGEIRLLRLPDGEPEAPLGAFSQYLPPSLRSAALRPHNLCVGALYGGAACGAALIDGSGDEPNLRWITVDPQARYCGVGTYLLEGLLGLAGEKWGGAPVRGTFTPDQLEGGKLSGIFARAGFSAPEPYATEFSCALGDLADPGGTAGLDCLPVLALPEEVLNQYYLCIMEESLPDFADFRKLRDPIPGLCWAAAADGVFAGVLLCEDREGALNVRGLYVAPEFRRRGVARELIHVVLTAAKTIWPPETRVIGTAINGVSFGICAGAFENGSAARQTAMTMTYSFS